MSPNLSRRAFLGGSVLAGAGVLAGPLARSSGATSVRPLTANCFGRADNARLDGLRVFQNAPPPANDTVDATYAYWPCTDAASQSDFGSSTWSGNKWHYIWSNRYNGGWNAKPNQLEPPTLHTSAGRECRVEYTTIAKANAATRGLIRYSLGRSDYAQPWVAAGGSASDFVDMSALAASPDTYFTGTRTVGATTYAVLTDVPWRSTFRLADVAAPTPGIMLDYEVQDDRGAAATTAFLQAVGDDVHAVGKEFSIWTNPLDAPTMVHTGLNATNLPGLSQDYVDLLSVQLWSGNQQGDVQASYDSQITLLTGTTGTEPVDYDRLAIVFELGGTTTADAATVHGILTGSGTAHPTVLMFWRNFAVQGGACDTTTNQKISTACFGS